MVRGEVDLLRRTEREDKVTQRSANRALAPWLHPVVAGGDVHWRDGRCQLPNAGSSGGSGSGATGTDGRDAGGGGN